ncbi:MAG: hypothetical protein AMJ81_04935 [Phycisphaerae bacterium SM23_33]|jgi:hypothetical protein|nr:MAG: hypothetical protein AMJ81_04935 [Phycisphaerae bacterium SM23_33]
MSDTVINPGDASAPRASRGGWVHFGVAAALLLAAAAGFHVAVRLLRIHLVKAAVPLPEAARLDGHWLANFPQALGPDILGPDGRRVPRYVLAPDGYRKLTEDVLRELGTTKHRLNWYYSAFYRDNQVTSIRAEDQRYFILDVTYYTGLVDPVPHIPEICLLAGGFAPLPGESASLTLELPDLPEPWREWRQIKVRRAAYALKDTFGAAVKSAQYYVFSMNGEATDSRSRVRWDLTWPTRNYCYFAKIQAAPGRPEASAAASDEVSLEFLRHAIPAALRFLPSADDVKRLEDSGKQRKS